MNTFKPKLTFVFFSASCKDLRTGVIWSLYIVLDNNCGL